MIPFHADTFYGVLSELLEFERGVGVLYEEKGGKALLEESDSRKARLLLGAFFRECEQAQLTRPLERAEKLRYLGEADRDQSQYPLETVKWELKELREAAFTDLRKRTLLGLEDNAEANYENSELFGPEVAEKFEKAAYDIREAGSCHATGRYTACVFIQ